MKTSTDRKALFDKIAELKSNSINYFNVQNEFFLIDSKISIQSVLGCTDIMYKEPVFMKTVTLLKKLLQGWMVVVVISMWRLRMEK